MELKFTAADAATGVLYRWADVQPYAQNSEVPPAGIVPVGTQPFTNGVATFDVTERVWYQLWTGTRWIMGVPAIAKVAPNTPVPYLRTDHVSAFGAVGIEAGDTGSGFPLPADA